VRQAIIWTVFKNRWKNTSKYAIILADLDVHQVWLQFHELLYYADFWMAIEIGKTQKGTVDIHSWFSDITYFKFIMWIEKKIFLYKPFQKIFLQQSLQNIHTYINIKKNNFKNARGFEIKEIFEYWKNNDITLSEFKKRYF
jgi:hypothetical protein